MALYMMGIGLFDEKDISVRGLDIIRSCDVVFLENYTSVLHCDIEDLVSFYGKSIILADRDLVENRSDDILISAKDKDVAFLVVGDVMGATTHTDLFLRARKLGIEVRFIHNASILNAVGMVGLELYKYGKTTSIVFPDPDWVVDTPYDVIKKNKEMGLHTLCLLDIKVKESSRQDILHGVSKPQEKRFMSVSEAISELMNMESRRKECVLSADSLIIGCARIGSPDCLVKSGLVSSLKEFDFGPPLHCLIIPGNLHFVEEEAISYWR